MTLKELETKWLGYLVSDACPPVLGLAPLSEEESEHIGKFVEAVRQILEKGNNFKGPPWRSFFRLLEEFPACTTVWLARKAGEAYEAGAFWEKFGELIGITIPLNQRDNFAQKFRTACRKTMATWLPPKELGAHNIVAEFLHQAGLPLDRCAGFAQHVRKVERSFGLPDANSPDAGEQLCEAVLESLQPISVPTLKRALRGPAGPRICEVALGVVLRGDFSGINPLLGQELERVFEHAERSALRRSARQPFLRLGEDLGSLEIVGPTQDASLVGNRGLTWVVDGRRFPIPRTEEFVLTVTDRPRVTLELSGLVLGSLPVRAIVLRLADLAEPFMLFDEASRRQRRAGGAISAGAYWLLHRASDTLIGAEQRYEWPSDERALSLFTLRPGAEARLESETGGPWNFTTTLTPFFDPVGEKLASERGEPIWFGWIRMPLIWLPTEEVERNRVVGWRVNLRLNNFEHIWTLSPTEIEAGGMIKCLIESGDFLAELQPGMHRLDMELLRGERSRAEAQVACWFWQGLNGYNARGFELGAWPSNLLQEECRGFAFGEGTIRHIDDQHRRHKLAFNVDETATDFHWSQPGVFLESVERSPGQHAKPRTHRLGEAFSVSLSSSRWLRIWISGQQDWEVVVAGQSWQRSVRDDSRGFLELSLASLAMSFPEGGEIKLRIGEFERLIGRFSRPLQPLAVDFVADGEHSGFRFEFSEPIEWIRPIVLDLASGERRSLPGQQIGKEARCVFETEDLPLIGCSNLVGTNDLGTALANILTLQVTKRMWPEGVWIIELEVRRDEYSEWEPVALGGRKHAPVVIRTRDGQSVSTPRARLLWACLTLQLLDSMLDNAEDSELFELLADLMVLRQQGIAPAARLNMEWSRSAVRYLSQFAGRVARQPQRGGLQTKLLNLACQDSDHEGFVHLPSLLALPAARYAELPVADPLNDALRRCGRLGLADSVAEAVRQDFAFLDMDVLGCFANFADVATAPNDEPILPEFNHFAHERYWKDVLGTPLRERLAPDWSGESALGKAHFVWALTELARRYDLGTHLYLAAANALLNSAPKFRAWLQERLSPEALMSAIAWSAPWPRFIAPEDFLENVPRFASLFALAARASAAGLLSFDETLNCLEQQVERRWMAEEGIAVLVGLAPELFGHQLLFWELIVRTAPH